MHSRVLVNSPTRPECDSQRPESPGTPNSWVMSFLEKCVPPWADCRLLPYPVSDSVSDNIFIPHTACDSFGHKAVLIYSRFLLKLVARSISTSTCIQLLHFKTILLDTTVYCGAHVLEPPSPLVIIHHTSFKQTSR